MINLRDKIVAVCAMLVHMVQVGLVVTALYVTYKVSDTLWRCISALKIWYEEWYVGVFSPRYEQVHAYLYPVPKPTVEVVLDTVDAYIEKCLITVKYAFYRTLTLKSKLFNYVLILLVFLVVLYVFGRFVKKMAFKLKCKFSGMTDFRGEAHMDGSSFERADIPAYQVEIYGLGALTNVFLGYGIRYADHLVTPTHVLGTRKELVLGNRGKKAIVDISPIQSTVVQDLSYVHIDQVVWTNLGVKASKCSKSVGTERVIVHCTGRSGRSVGSLAPTDYLGILKYSGSTEPGYSGASYHHPTVGCYGIHAGTVGGCTNVGYSMLVISAEIDMQLSGETAYEDDDDNVSNMTSSYFEFKGKPKRGKSRGKGWTMGDVKAATANSKFVTLDENVRNWDGYARQKKEEDPEWFDWAEETAEKPKKTRLIFEGQSPTGKPVEIKTRPAPTLGDAVRKLQQQVEKLDKSNEEVHTILRDMHIRLKKLEDRVFPQEGAKPKSILKKTPVINPESAVCDECGLNVKNIKNHIKMVHKQKTHKCEICGKLFRTATGLSHHVLDHPQVIKLESALPGDFQEVVKTKPFLSKSPSRGKNMKSSKNSSKSQESSPASLQMQEFLLRMSESLRNIENALRTSRKVTDGPKLVAQQK